MSNSPVAQQVITTQQGDFVTKYHIARRVHIVRGLQINQPFVH